MLRWVIALSVMALVAVGPTGCKEDEPGFKVVALAGTVEKIDKIDASSARVQISYYSEKRGREVSAEVLVTPETEIVINGQVARLEDIRIGERAEGEALVTHRGDQRTTTVKRVRIERAAAIVPATAVDPPNPPSDPAVPAGDTDGE